jgi:hypothetical protein
LRESFFPGLLRFRDEHPVRFLRLALRHKQPPFIAIRLPSAPVRAKGQKVAKKVLKLEAGICKLVLG